MIICDFCGHRNWLYDNDNIEICKNCNGKITPKKNIVGQRRIDEGLKPKYRLHDEMPLDDLNGN